MKLGDMTSKQIVENICRDNVCDECPFYDPDNFNSCPLTCVDPAYLNLNMEVNTNNENETW